MSTDKSNHDIVSGVVFNDIEKIKPPATDNGKVFLCKFDYDGVEYKVCEWVCEDGDEYFAFDTKMFGTYTWNHSPKLIGWFDFLRN